MQACYDLTHLTDNELLRDLTTLTETSSRLTAMQLAHIAEVDHRELYLECACDSMFSYGTRVLHLSEGGTYKRISVARAGRRTPLLFERIASGELHLSGAALLAPHLGEEVPEEKRRELIDAMRRKSKREIERNLAARFPKGKVTQGIRRLPRKGETTLVTQALVLQPKVATNETAASPSEKVSQPEERVAKEHRRRHEKVTPLSKDHYKLTVCADQELIEYLERAKALLRHQVPNGDLNLVLKKALRLLVTQQEKRRFGKSLSQPKAKVVQKQPRSKNKQATRYIPVHIRRAVVERDGARCTFVDESGVRCIETGGLEFHHKEPFSKTREHTPDGICLLCRPHNQYMAKKDFGPELIAAWKKSHEARTRAPSEPRSAVPGDSYNRGNQILLFDEGATSELAAQQSSSGDRPLG